MSLAKHQHQQRTIPSRLFLVIVAILVIVIVAAFSLLHAAPCTPLPSCVDNGNVSPCATPTPTLGWDPVPDTPTATLAGYKLYWRMPGGTFQLLVDIPCITEDDGSRSCPGAVAPSRPVQRYTPVELELVEFAVKAYDTDGEVSPEFSNVVQVCINATWKGGPYQ